MAAKNAEKHLKFQEDGVISKQDVEAALSKAVELRAIHAALLNGSINHSPSNNLNFSGHDYPIFTPSYEDASLPGSKKVQLNNQTFVDIWEEYDLGGAGNGDEDSLSNYRKASSSLRNGISRNVINFEPQICSADDQRSVTGSCTDQITVLKASPGGDYSKSTRNSLGGLRSVSSCHRCKPAVTSTDTDTVSTNGKSTKGLNLSRLFPKFKKKNKNEDSPSRTEISEEVSVSQIKVRPMVSIEALKKELMEANECRDAALKEVAEMKSSLGDITRKLEYLETYCEELKKALKEAVHANVKRGKLFDGENAIPVSEEVMEEGFLQMVSESRLSIRQFCKILIAQVYETDNSLTDNLNKLLQPYKLSLNSNPSKTVLYHIEAIVNRTLFQDFENVVFQKNGAPKHLDPRQECHAQFSSFVSLRNLSWNEVLRKGTKCYSEDFSKFCDQKMSCIVTAINWTRPWPEQLLQAFFIAAKCIWLLHLLAFSFNPPLRIFRVEEHRSYDKSSMEDIFANRERSQGPSKVKIMVMPGFYVHDRVLRCKVICRQGRS